MDKTNTLRSQYLNTMGIQVWQQRVSVNVAESINTEVDPETKPHAAMGVEHASGSGLKMDKHRTTPASSNANSSSTDIMSLSWPALEQAVATCVRCRLSETRSNTVFGVGNRQAEWMVIGEAPGAEEDRQGEPFVGRAGQLLNAMLKAIGLAREDVYIANILKSRPPQNRDPLPDEMAACEPFLMRQIQLIQPKIILAVGRIAAQNLLKTDTKISLLRGKRHVYPGTGTPLVATYHPAYLLRAPAEKRKAWEDLKFAVRVVKGEV